MSKKHKKPPAQSGGDAAILRAADRIAHEIIEQAVCVTDGARRDYFSLFYEAADEDDAKKARQLEALLSAFPPLSVGGDVEHACDVACDLYTPRMVAAYYIGLSVGRKLGGAR